MKVNTPTIRAILITYLVFYVTALYDVPPYSILIDKAVQAHRAVAFGLMLKDLKYPNVYWGHPRYVESGVVTHNTNLFLAGLTFFSSSLDHAAYLIDMQGNIVHRWSMPHEAIWPKPAHVARIVPEHLRLLTRAHLYPNGDILAQYTGVGSNPLGYGLAKLDKYSHLLWAYDGPVHHDMEVDDQGIIYTLSHKIRTETYPGLDSERARPPIYEDFLVLLAPDGTLIKEISFFDLLARGPAQKVLGRLNGLPSGETPPGDMIHPNGLELIDGSAADTYPMLQKGHLLVSFRNLSMLAVIDPQKEVITWATYLPTRAQHDPRILPDGTVLLFDNQGHVGPGGNSRIVRLDLNTSQILWQYTGTEEEPLYSAYHGSVDPLQNGNVLITESLQGRLLEVTPDGTIVWDYRSPWRIKDDEDVVVPAFYRARRYLADELFFLE
jgi:hypothetical protein